MPELPDIELYLHALRPRIVGQQLERIRLATPFLLRTVDPPIAAVAGRTVRDLRRIGKRVVWALDDELFVVIHLMIAGRFRWLPAAVPGASASAEAPADKSARQASAAIPKKMGLAAFDFSNGTLILTEAGAKRRASLHLVRGEAALDAIDPGGIDVLSSTVDRFGAALQSENHTLKRALTDPQLFSGIGNAYSDEILHAAQLSPTQLTSRLDAAAIARLHAASIDVLIKWRDDLIAETGDNFPEKVTAFRPGMAVHGRFGKPCPRCGTPIQRIRYAANEANYCPTCQTGGKLLADRSLSRLLKDDWPKSLEQLEERKQSLRSSS